jgi:hypothetical protein
MVTFRNNNSRRGNFRRNERNYKTNGDRQKFSSNFSNNDSFKRKSPGRNNHNAPKLIEKYNDLAREASSNGDKILSENYLQHADHFTRILNEKENVRKEKYLDNKTDNETPADETIDIANDINKKNLSENSAEETVVKKSAKSQTELD